MYQTDQRIRDARASHYIFMCGQRREHRRRAVVLAALAVACVLAPVTFALALIGGAA